MSTFNERYEAYKKKKSVGSFQKRYLQWKVEKGELDIDAVGKDLSNRVNTWLDNNQKYFTEANTRFSGDNSVYRADASDWLNSATSRNQTFQTEANSIKKDLEYYGSLWGDDYVNSVLEALNGNLEAQKSILDAANKDVEYWSQWDNEDAWKADYDAFLAQEEQKKANLEYDLVAGKTKIADLEKQLNSIGIMTSPDEDFVKTMRDAYELFGWGDKERLEELEKHMTATNELQELLEDERQRYASAELAQKREGYNALAKESDFALNSQPVSKYVGGEQYNAFANQYVNLGYADYNDLLHGYINGEPAARRVVSTNDMQNGGTFWGYDNSQLLEMTADEVSIYNYVYNTQGKEAANAYIDFIMSDLNARKRAKEEEYWAAEANESPFLTSIFSVASSPLKTFSFIGQTADLLADGSIDQNAGYNKFAYSNTAIRNEVSKKIEEKWGGVGSFAYQTGMSMADFLLNSAITGGNATFSSAILGTSAAADTVISAKDRGLSDSQAYTLGVIAGAAELITEKYSLETLLDKTSLDKNALGYLLKNILAEGSEEVASSVINLFADVLVSKDKSEWQALINEYKRQGMDDQEAFWHAVGDQALSLGLDFLGGAISGGVMAGGSIGINAVANKVGNKIEQNRRIQTHGNELIEMGAVDPLVEMGKSVTNNKGITRAVKKVEKNASAKNVGNLSLKILKNIGKTTAQIESALVKEGLSQSEAKLVAKYSMGEDLTDAEIQEVESNNKYIEAVNKALAKVKKPLTKSATSEIIESEATTNEGTSRDTTSVHLRNGGERVDGENTERQILRMESGSGTYSQWEKALRSGSKDRQAFKLRDKGRAVTVASLGVSKGSNIHTVKVLDNVENETESMKEARKYAEERGLTIKFFVGGNLIIEEDIDANVGKADADKKYYEANGYIRGKVMLVRADHHKFTADQIARHEAAHDKIKKGEVNLKEVKAKLSKMEHFDKITQAYAEAYEGSGYNEDRIFEEMVCDSLGEMNIFAYGADAELMSKAIPVVQSVVNEPSNAPNQTRGSPESEGKASKEFSSPEEAKESGKISDARFSIDFSGDIANKQRAYLNNGGARISSVELEKAIADTARMVDKMKPYANILPQDKVGKTLVKNGSYDVSVENTTVCIRTLAYNSFVDMVSEKVGRPLTQMESFLVSQKLYEIAKEPQCLYCYVSLDRKAFNEMVIRYTEQRDEAIAAYEAAGKPKIPSTMNKEWSLFKEFLNGRKPTQNMWDRYVGWLKAYNNGERLVSLSDISTEAKRLALVESGGEVASQVKDILKYAQSASWAKKQTQYVAYYDEILKLKPTVIKNLNSHYGMRWYSFSDYSGAFIVENMQQITDAAIRGLKGLSYTKDTDFAEIFAPTGMNINISVYAHKTENGYEIDPKQSADIKKAIALRKQYPNVGIVVVATDTKGVEWALEQEWSDVVIPFHTVRTGADVAEFYNWEIFNTEQNDTVADQNLWDEYVKSVGKKKVSKMVYPSEHQNDLDTYLEICKERGLTPRFKSFLDNPNYMKLVNETRQSESETAPLKAIFDVEAAERSFDKFVEKGGYYEGWYNDGIDVDGEAEIVASDVLAGKKANEVDYGRQDVDFDALKKSRKENRQHGKASREMDSDYFTAQKGVGVSYNLRLREYSLKEIAQIYKRGKLAPEYDVLFNKLYSFCHNAGITFSVVPEVRNDEGKRVAGVARGNKILLDQRIFNGTKYSDKTKSDVILHEMIHTATVYAIKAYDLAVIDGAVNELPKNIQKIGKDIFKVYASIKDDPLFKNEYGVKNPEEMVSCITKPDFALKLKASYTSAWHKILEGICELLGINKKFNNYDKLAKALDSLLTHPDYALARNYYGIVDKNAHYLEESQYEDISDSGKASRELDVINYMDAVAIAEGRDMYEGKPPSDRERLANALESVAQNDIERKRLNEYKANIEKMNAETEKLKKLKAEIKELTFGKDKKDPQRLKTLREEATKTENRINTYDKKLLNLEASTVLKDILLREKKKAYQKAAAKGRETLHKNVEGRNKTAMRHKIQDVAHRLDKLLNHATKERNVKKGQSALVRRALDLTDLLFASDDDLLMNGIETLVSDKELDAMNKYIELYNKYHSYDDAVSENKEIRKEIRSEMNEVKKDFEGALERERKRISTARSTDVFNALIAEYDKLAQSEDKYIKYAFDAETKKYLEGLRDTVGDTLVKDMTLNQLEAVYKAFRMIEKMISDSNKMFNETIKASAEELGTKTRDEVVAHKRKDKFTALGKAYSELSWNNLKPIYLMERIGSKTLQMLFDNILEGESTFAKYAREAQNYMDEQKKKYNFKNWDFKKKWKFTTKTGLEFELDLGQLLTIYAYAQRGEQALNHLRMDGFVFDKVTVIEKGVKYELNDKTAYKLDDDNIFKITGNPFTQEKGILTDEQIAYVTAMQKYLSETLGKRGNEVSNKMYGIDLFTEENYLPIISEGAYLERVREQANGTPKIKNRGMTKPTTPGAKNPIVLFNFNELWSKHSVEMNEYAALTLPLEDFYKVYNYTNKSSEDSNKNGVIPAIENTYGKDASKAIDQLLTDLNGGTRTDYREGIVKGLTGAFKKAKVMLSASVIVQQPSSILRAQAVIDPKYFVGKKLDKQKHKEAWEELKKYAPVAIIKEMGYFDVGMGRTTADWIMNEPDWKDRLDEITSKGAAYADEVTWIAIWDAVKRETLHTRKDLVPNSKEFLEAAGKRFEKVIRLTQVYDSTLSRSAYMRSKSAMVQMLTAFMAESTTSLNMREMALRSGDKNRIIRTTAAVYASALLNAILVAFPYAMRDDDEDETFVEKYISALTTNFVGNVNPLTSIPFIKDIWSIAQGYSVERADMTLVDDFISSIKGVISESVKEDTDPKALTNAIINLVGDFANMTGIPVKNLVREIKAMINFGKTITNGQTTTWNSLMDTLEKSFQEETPIWGWLPKETKKEKIVEAIQKGDKTYVERFKSSYEDEKSFYSAVKSEVGDLYRSGKMTSREAEKILKKYGGFDKEEADNDIYWLIKEWDYKKKHGKDAEYSKYTEWYEAVKTGRNIKSVIQDYTSHGVDAETLASQITKYYKPLYIKMSKSERASIKGYLLNAYALLGYNRSEKSRDIDKWLKG